MSEAFLWCALRDSRGAKRRNSERKSKRREWLIISNGECVKGRFERQPGLVTGSHRRCVIFTSRNAARGKQKSLDGRGLFWCALRDSRGAERRNSERKSKRREWLIISNVERVKGRFERQPGPVTGSRQRRVIIHYHGIPQ